MHPGGNVESAAQAAAPHYDSRASAGPRQKPKTEVDEADKRQFLLTAQERFAKIISKVEQEWRENAAKELDFCDGLKHWAGDQLEQRKGLPCLVVDKIGPAIGQVLNDARQNPPEPKVSPVGDGSTKWTAEVLQGMLRNIENDSNGQIAWMTAYEHAVKIGRGWYRMAIEYESQDSFELKLVIKRVANPFSVYPDPATCEFDYSDMRYCFVTEDLDRDVFRDLYPDAQANSADFEGVGDRIKEDWFPSGAVRVAEYWRVETKRETIAQLADKRVMPLAEAQRQLTPTFPGGPLAPARIVNVRAIERRTVWVAKITGFDVLEDIEWTGKWIPLIPVIGKELIYDKQRHLRGMIKPAMDSNLLFDYACSKQAEAIGLAPMSQWIVAKGQLENFEWKWADSNRRSFAFLEYNHICEETGQPYPGPPIRVSPSVDLSSIVQAIQTWDNNAKSSTETYDASLGKRGPESSGIAIRSLQTEGDNAHFNFRDNLAWSLKHGARVAIDLFPHVYNEEQVTSIYDPDGQVRQVRINQFHEDPQAGWIMLAIGKDYKPTRYDVLLSTGPSYASRREAAVNVLATVSQANPQVMVRGGDLFVKMLDGLPEPLRSELAERLRPPDVANVEEGQSPMRQLQQQQGQLQQMQQMIQLLTQELQKATQTIQQKQIETSSKERIAAMGDVTQLLVAETKAGSQQAAVLTQAEYQKVRDSFEMMLQAHQAVQQQAQQAQPAQPAAPAQPGQPQ